MNKDNYASKTIEFASLGDAYRRVNSNECRIVELVRIAENVNSIIRERYLKKILESSKKNTVLADYIINKAIAEAVGEQEGLSDEERSSITNKAWFNVKREIKNGKPDFTEIPQHDVEYKIGDVSICMTVGNRLIGTPKSILSNEDVKPFSDMKALISFINEKIGFYFEENDFYCNFSKSESNVNDPTLCARKTITSDVVQGSKSLTKYFGPTGRFADYLYKADGTAKIEPSKNSALDKFGADRDVNVVDKFPVLHLLASVSASDDGGAEYRPLITDDFRGTEVEVIE